MCVRKDGCGLLIARPAIPALSVVLWLYIHVPTLHTYQHCVDSLALATVPVLLCVESPFESLYVPLC